MDWVLHALTWWVPWWVWVGLGIGGGWLAWRLLGWQGIVAVVGGVVGVLTLQHQRRAGYQDRVDDEAEGLAKQEEKWDEIDRKPRDFDRSLDNLRRLRNDKDRG